jgi:hypothetical protein
MSSSDPCPVGQGGDAVSVASFVAAQRTEFGVPHACTCRILEISESWFYEWRNRPRRHASSANGCVRNGTGAPLISPSSSGPDSGDASEAANAPARTARRSSAARRHAAASHPSATRRQSPADPGDAEARSPPRAPPSACIYEGRAARRTRRRRVAFAGCRSLLLSSIRVRTWIDPRPGADARRGVRETNRTALAAGDRRASSVSR